VDVHATNSQEALMLAARYGHQSIVELLIANGVDVHATDKHGWTALMYAARHGHQPIVKLLIANGAVVNATNSQGWTALMFAARDGHAAIVELLIAKGAVVNAATVERSERGGRTALTLSCEYGYPGCAQVLIEGRADVDKKQFAESGCEKCLEILLRHGAVLTMNTLDDASRTALMYAAKGGHDECVKVLLEYKVDVNVTNSMGVTALSLATQYKKETTEKILIDGAAKRDGSDYRPPKVQRLDTPPPKDHVEF
jgi:ankyrin repeat protein